MATRKPKAPPKSNFRVIRATAADSVESIDLDVLTRNCLRLYGEEVNLDRSVPDYRDGMKPVTRRLLYALHTMGNQTVKTARLSGETLGKYHPHGQASVNGAVHTQVIANTPPITGIGNWGSIIDPPGADRYTNVKMSLYGKSFFDSSYMPLMSKIDSYDGKEKEPLFLPALLPQLLLNGIEGIGLGLSTSIPAFTPVSLLPLMADLAEGQKISSEDMARRLVPYHMYGGEVVKSKQNRDALVAFMDSFTGSIMWTSPLEVSEETKTVRINKFCPTVNPIKLVEDFLKPMREVSTVHSGSGVSYTIQCRRDINMPEFRAFVEKLRKKVSTKYSYEIYITRRDLREDNSSKYEVKFRQVTLRQLIELWVRYRIDLERSSIKHQIEVSKAKIAHFGLLLLACSKLDIIFQALRLKDPKAFIVKNLKITDEQAETILNLKVRQLSKLDNDQILSMRKKEESVLAQLKEDVKIPHRIVADYLRSKSTQFKLVRNDWSNQWILD